jgi:protein-S-isoprenylcysteine O-methyltransferase Ste14
MGSNAVHLAWLAIAWAAYGAVHSLLAAAGFKVWMATRAPRWVPAYRLLYNLVAVLALVPVLGLMASHPGPWLWRWQGPLAWLMNGLALVAAGLLVFGPGTYDLSEFVGLRQLRERRLGIGDQEPLRISALHRYVRHPWYALSLVLIWTRDMNAAMLVSALAVTAYFVIGSRLEERKLLARFGAAYGQYMSKVPGLVPCPWRRLSREEARQLEGR